jgi:hypothetical protein
LDLSAAPHFVGSSSASKKQQQEEDVDGQWWGKSKGKVLGNRTGGRPFKHTYSLETGLVPINSLDDYLIEVSLGVPC